MGQFEGQSSRNRRCNIYWKRPNDSVISWVSVRSRCQKMSKFIRSRANHALCQIWISIARFLLEVFLLFLCSTLDQDIDDFFHFSSDHCLTIFLTVNSLHRLFLRDSFSSRSSGPGSSFRPSPSDETSYQHVLRRKDGSEATRIAS